MNRPRKADVVARDLLGRIVTGKLAVGSVMPTEPELSLEYGVNRSVVREAIKELEVHGLVRPVRRRGTLVLDPLRSPSPDVLRAMLSPRPGVIDRAALAELLEVRARLDVEMTALAAERRSDADLVAMSACLRELAAALGEPERYSAAMEELTMTIAHATRNRIYQMLVHWHSRVRIDVPVIQLVIRFANEPHLQGVTFLVDLIRGRQVDDARTFVSAVHRWAIPRILAAAALASGEPLATAQESLQ
jgi:DNA-binding FadR family transcriptional regulator